MFKKSILTIVISSIIFMTNNSMEQPLTSSDWNAQDMIETLILSIKAFNFDLTKQLIANANGIDFGFFKHSHFSPLMALCQIDFEHNKELCSKKVAALEILQYLIALEPNINKRDSFGRTALMYAAYHSDVEFIECLLNAKADVTIKDDQGHDVYSYAIKNPNSRVRDFIQNKFNCNAYDKKRKHTEQIQNAKSCKLKLESLDISKEFGDLTSCSKNSVQSMKSDTMELDLLAAIKVCDFEKVTRLVKDGANVNFSNDRDMNETPLTKLCGIHYPNESENALKILKCLIDNGAIVDCVNAQGSTPLMLAAEMNNLKICEYLLKAHANVNIKDKDGRTCLTYYAESKEFYQLMITYGGNINDNDDKGVTCLMTAAEFANLNDIKFLLANGADVTAKDNEGHDIIYHAKQNERRIILKFIQDYIKQSDRSINADNPDPKFQSGRSEQADELTEDLLNDIACWDFESAIETIKCGANVNFIINSDTPLTMVCTNDQDDEALLGMNDKQIKKIEIEVLEAAKQLIIYGADVNYRYNGKTSLMLCLEKAFYPSLTRYLINEATTDKNVDIEDNVGQTALMYCKDPEFAALLINKGANINATDSNGTNSLMHAIFNKNIRMIKFFISRGINLNCKDNNNKTYRDYVQDENIGKFLLSINITENTISDLEWFSTQSRLLKAQYNYTLSQQASSITDVKNGLKPRIRLANPISDTGLRCFINAIFQCLLHLDKLVQLLPDKKDYYNKSSLADMYVASINQLQPINDTFVDLTSFSMKVWKSLEADCGTQQDAGEFLNYLLDRLLDEDIRQEIKSNLPCYESTTIPITELSKLFCFTTESIKTERDKEPTIVKEYGTMLNISIVSNCSSLDDCLRLYFTKEILQKDEQGQPLMEKQYLLAQPSPYMIINLKRYESKIDDTTGDVRFTKNNAALSFPMELSLPHQEHDLDEQTEGHYTLVSFVLHTGTIQMGHYTAFVKIDNQWYYFDDAQIPKLISPEEISKIIEQGYYRQEETTPTIFFYSKNQ